MNGMDHDGNDELVRRLQAYAGARLSPDQWASVRMRTAVIEHGRAARAAAPRRYGWRQLVRQLGFVALVGVLAIATGSSAAFAASPGGPLYDARLWVETALIPFSGDPGAARVDQIDQRIDEVTSAVNAGNGNAANAAGNAYTTEVDQAAQAAQNRADLLALQAAVSRQLTHLQGMAHGSPKAQANLNRLIANAQAALADINAKLAALPAPSSTP